MSSDALQVTDALLQYVRTVGVREHRVLAELREETQRMREASMQIAPEQGELLALLVRLTDARSVLEIGTFTGYSSTAMALALPPHGRLVCLDVSREWTDRAQRAWSDAGVDDRVELRLGPAADSLGALEDGSFDLAFIDADKTGYDAYYEGCLRVVRSGGLVVLDNTLQHGLVVDAASTTANVRAIRDLNTKIHADERVDAVLLPIADGVTLARIR